MPDTKTLIRVPVERERRAAMRMTGRYLLTLRPESHEQITTSLSRIGVAAATPLAPGAQAARPLQAGHHIVLPHVGVAIVDPVPGQEEEVYNMAAQEAAVIALEPERINRVVANGTADYLRGWRDATEALTAKLLDGAGGVRAAPAAAAAEELATWGLIAALVVKSRYSGANIKLAVLDTGFDQTHPDFTGRRITTMNFVGDNTPFHDGVGHGTHCVGTAAGPLHPSAGPRYGIAYSTDIFVGRVLDDTGHGGDANIIHGIDWAIANGCQVISLSLGAAWTAGDPPYSTAYEQAAQRALAAGCLLVVAAGNDADDPQYLGAVGTPGNSPSVLTVAAVDQTLATAAFSNHATPDAPGVKGPDIAGPGVGVYSAWPVADGSYDTLDGTSMATPHVAGIAALWAEAVSTARGQALKDLVLAHCLALPNGASRQGQIGCGLVQASAT